MATGTTSFPVIFCIQERLMDILVAFMAPDAYIPEFPPGFFFMTGEARGSKVSALQLELACVMLFYCK